MVTINDEELFRNTSGELIRFYPIKLWHELSKEKREAAIKKFISEYGYYHSNCNHAMVWAFVNSKGIKIKIWCTAEEVI